MLPTKGTYCIQNITHHTATRWAYHTEIVKLVFCCDSVALSALQNHIYDRQVKRLDTDKIKLQEKLDEAAAHSTQLNNHIQDLDRQINKFESKVRGIRGISGLVSVFMGHSTYIRSCHACPRSHGEAHFSLCHYTDKVYLVIDIGGYLYKQPLCINCSVTDSFPERLRWCLIE